MRYLGLDVGDKTIGVAVNDLLGITVQGVTTIKRRGIKNDLEALKELVREYQADGFVVGLPKNMDASLGTRALLSQEFSDMLKVEFPDLSVDLYDERLTTVAAEKMLIGADVSRKKRKEVVDKIAAVFILQGYLAKKANILNKGE